jgi:phosphoesterase RecJ-like protein
VQKLAREVLGSAIQTLKDPRVGFVTITSVRVTPDLRQMRALVSVFGSDEEKTSSLEGLKSARPFLRSELGRQVRLKYLPDLTFELDNTTEEAARLEALFDRIHDEREAVLRFNAEDWPEVIAALRRADEVVISCHVNPDGDAVGSLLAASLGLRQLGKRTFPTWPGLTGPLPGYEFLPGTDSLMGASSLPEATTFLALDCGGGDRLAELHSRAKAAETVINIDHHPGNDNFGTLNVVVPEVSSTAEIVARLLQDLEVEIDVDIATCLYTGIFTDTGSFQYTNTSPDTLRLAADLLELGVDKTAIAQSVLENAPFGFLQLVARVLGRAVLHEKERFAYSLVTHEDLRVTEVKAEETDQLIDLLRSTRDADVAAIFKQQSGGTYRASLRSKGPVSVGEIARARGGGGHELAAGFTTEDVDATVAEIVAELGAG